MPIFGPLHHRLLTAILADHLYQNADLTASSYLVRFDLA